MAQTVYIAHVDASPGVQRKIAEKHGVTFAEVKEAVILTRLLGARWVIDDERGERLYVKGITAEGRRVNAVLYPVDKSDGTWRLGTAMPGM